MKKHVFVLKCVTFSRLRSQTVLAKPSTTFAILKKPFFLWLAAFGTFAAPQLLASVFASYPAPDPAPFLNSTLDLNSTLAPFLNSTLPSAHNSSLAPDLNSTLTSVHNSSLATSPIYAFVFEHSFKITGVGTVLLVYAIFESYKAYQVICQNLHLLIIFVVNDENRQRTK
jgi:hypothetical protein